MKLFSSTVFGIDISDRSIKAAEIKKSDQKYTLVSYAHIDLPQGTVEDGLIHDEEKLVQALSELVINARPSFSSKTVAISLPESRTMRYLFSFPKQFKESEIREAVPFEAEKVMPFDTTNAYWDFQLLGEEKGKQLVLYATAPQKLMAQYIHALSQAKLQLKMVTLEAQSLAASLISEYNKDSLIVLLDIGARTSTITIADQLGIRFTLSVSVAGNHFTQAVSKNLSISEEEAGRKREQNGPASQEISNAISPLLKRIATETKKAISFVEQKTGKKISKVILCGGSSLMPGMLEFMQKSIEHTVTVGNPLTKIVSSKKLEKPLLYGTVFGSAIQATDNNKHLKGINLLNNN